MKRLIALASAGLMLATAASADVTVRGSDTMLNLVQKLAEDFMTQHPAVTVSVTGGGSGTGIAAILSKEISIADHSRDLKAKELEQARMNGVDIKTFAIAQDGLAIIVNSANPVRTLSMDQLGAVYRGDVKNWSQLGGPNRKINLYGRQPNSGTFTFMIEMVLRGNYALTMRQMNGNAEIVEAVKADPAGIGYAGVGYVAENGKEKYPQLAVVRLSAPGKAACSPLERDKVMNGTYPLVRPLWQSTNGTPRGDIRSFIAYELSSAGRKTVEAEGFFPLTHALIARNQSLLK